MNYSQRMIVTGKKREELKLQNPPKNSDEARKEFLKELFGKMQREHEEKKD